jgi:hypothetical protein
MCKRTACVKKMQAVRLWLPLQRVRVFIFPKAPTGCVLRTEKRTVCPNYTDLIIVILVIHISS